MKSKKKWISLDEIEELEDADIISCDTRDFHILCSDMSIEDKQTIMKDIQHKFGYGTLSDCKFVKSEIVPILKQVKSNTGGNLSWRMIRMNNGDYPIWIKYIRFLKTDGVVNINGQKETVYLAYTKYINERYVLTRKALMSFSNDLRNTK